MAVTNTPRFALKKYSSGGDPHPTRVDFNAMIDALETQSARYAEGVTASRPTAGKSGSFYRDTTTGAVYLDSAGAWVDISTNGGGGAGAAIVVAGAAAEGTSARGARADHTHNLPLATGTTAGALSAADKAKLDAATSTATAGTLIRRSDGGGYFDAPTPTSGAHVANKSYVDTQIGTRAPSTHTHDASDIDSGTLSAARLPAATGATAGALSAADKTKLDAATPNATENTLMYRGLGGNVYIGTATASGHAASKGYVDSQIGTRAPSAHTHAYSSLTGIPATFAPSAHGHDWSEIANTPATYAPSAHSHSWASITSKPTTFAPSDHTHLWADLTDKPTTFAPSAHTHSYSSLTGIPTTFAPSAHSHSATDITSGTLPAARLPLATSLVNGAIRASDQALLDSATYSPTGSALVQRHSSGSIQVVTGSNANDAANKAYVDSGLADKSDTGHTHSWSSITSKPSWIGSSKPVYSAAEINVAEFTSVQSEIDKLQSGKLDVSAWNSRVSGDSAHSKLRSPSGNYYIAVHDSGYVWSPSVYATSVTVGASAWRAMWVNENGVLGYNLSSRKYKTAERPYEVSLDVLRAVEPKWFKYREEVDRVGLEAAGDRVNFMAEDVFDAGLVEFVSFDGEGTARENVETINEQLMVSALWSFARQQQVQIDELRETVAHLGGQ